MNRAKAYLTRAFGAKTEIEELERRKNKRYAQRIAELKRIVEEVNGVIESIDDRDTRTVLRLRYIDSLPWSEVFNSVFYSPRQAYRCHARGLSEVERMLNNDTDTLFDRARECLRKNFTENEIELILKGSLENEKK